MKLELVRKVVALTELSAVGERCALRGSPVVLCHGAFDIVHPGHVRYLQSAAQQAGNDATLVVSLMSDAAIERVDAAKPYIGEQDRALQLAALECVDHVVIVDAITAEPVIAALRPALYVKGQEYEQSQDAGFHAERTLVERHGGRVLFSSGDVVFEASNMLETMAGKDAGDGWDATLRLGLNCRRWGIDLHTVTPMLRGPQSSNNSATNGNVGENVIVLGDTICDRYVFCEQVDVADEAPVLSLRPRRETSYLGGAAIIAGHLKALGAQPHLVTCVGNDDDEPTRTLLDTLNRMGITHTALPLRDALPVKQRFLADRQKLLKVNHGEAHPLDSAAQRQLMTAVADLRQSAVGMVMADFGYGTISTPLLEKLLPTMRPHLSMIAGDVSGPRGTLRAMQGIDLVTPTEREVRGIAGDFERSLPTVAMELMRSLNVRNVITTLGAKGSVLFHVREVAPAEWFERRLRTEWLPALGDRVEDVVGAGDALLATATLAMLRGATLPQAGYLGSAAAAVAVSRIGNLPVQPDEVLRLLRTRPELNPAHTYAAAS